MEFNETTHEYVHNGDQYTSVTQLLKKYGLSANYGGIPSDVLAKAANKGKAIHKALELFIGGDHSMLGLVNEVDLFQKYVVDNGIDLTHAKSEQMLFDTTYKIAGTIDFQYTQGSDVVVADFKTTSALHLDSVAWQLSIYNYLVVGGDLMNYYFNKLKVFHFTGGKLDVRDVYTVDYDQVKALLDANLLNEPTFTYKKTTQVISSSDHAFLLQISEEIESYESVLEKLKQKQKVILDQAKEAMIKQKDYFYRTSDFDLVYSPAQSRKTLDATAVKEFITSKGEDPQKFMKETITGDSVRFKLKK